MEGRNQNIYNSNASNFHIFLKKSVWLNNIAATDIRMRTYNLLDYFKLASFGVLVS